MAKFATALFAMLCFFSYNQAWQLSAVGLVPSVSDLNQSFSNTTNQMNAQRQNATNATITRLTQTVAASEAATTKAVNDSIATMNATAASLGVN